MRRLGVLFLITILIAILSLPSVALAQQNDAISGAQNNTYSML